MAHSHSQITSSVILHVLHIYIGERCMKWGKPRRRAKNGFRNRPNRWGDIRLWVGVIVLIGSMFIGARVVSSGENTVTLWRATHDLAVGSSSLALEPVVVELGSVGDSSAHDQYMQGNDVPTGTVIRPIGQGEFVPISALAPASALLEKTRIVTVPVDPLHIAMGINAGDQVDVWSTVDPTRGVSTTLIAPEKVLANITVVEVASEVVGTGGDIGVVLSVPEEDVSRIVEAMRTGVMDLVKVPVIESTSRNSLSDQGGVL